MNAKSDAPPSSPPHGGDSQCQGYNPQSPHHQAATPNETPHEQMGGLARCLKT